MRDGEADCAFIVGPGARNDNGDWLLFFVFFYRPAAKGPDLEICRLWPCSPGFYRVFIGFRVVSIAFT